MIFKTRNCFDQEIVHFVYDLDEYQLQKLNLSDVKVIVDIGGHIGAFGLKALSLWPQALLLAYEPSPESSQLYRENLTANNFLGVVATAAINSDKTKTSLAISEGVQCEGCYTLINEHDPGKKFLPNQSEKYSIITKDVVVVTLEEAIAELDRIDLMKIDCEGCELDILQSMKPKTAAKIGCMIGEWHFDHALLEPLIKKSFPCWKVRFVDKKSWPEAGVDTNTFLAGPESVLLACL